jgi:hypothetical protein
MVEGVVLLALCRVVEVGGEDVVGVALREMLYDELERSRAEQGLCTKP